MNGGGGGEEEEDGGTGSTDGSNHFNITYITGTTIVPSACYHLIADYVPVFSQFLYSDIQIANAGE